MDDKLVERLEATEVSLEKTLTQLADQAVLSDQKRYREVTGRHAQLKPIVELFRKYVVTAAEVEEARELEGFDDDAEMAAYLSETIANGSAEMETFEEQLRALLIPKDPNDDKDVIVEVRAAAGGDEAMSFERLEYNGFSCHRDNVAREVASVGFDASMANIERLLSKPRLGDQVLRIHQAGAVIEIAH